jgi:hypothetical protein
MTGLPDLIAQGTVLAFLLLAARYRHLIEDMTDGNVERLEREERNVEEARRWLTRIEESK